MRILRIAAVAVVVAMGCVGPSWAETADGDEKVMYALGVALTQSLQALNLRPAEVEHVARGLRDGLLGKATDVDMAEFRSKFQEFAEGRAEEAAAAEKEKSAGFIAAAEKEAGAVKTESGLIYKEITAGTGESPKATDKVKVHYHGTLADGTVFDSSVERGQPASFRLNGVIKCWTEGVQKMKVGGKSKLICPSEIAYGDRGSPPKIKPGAVLIFEVELLEIEAASAPAAE